MMAQRLFFVFMLAALGLGGYGAWLSQLPIEAPSSEPGFIVELPVCDLGGVGLGEHQVEVRITNPGPRSRQILGMMQGCRETCCFGPANPKPIAVAPGATVSYPCLIEIQKSGPFSVPVVLFLEQNGIREARRHTVQGIASTTEKKDDPALKCKP